jgi:hypothetical protein
MVAQGGDEGRQPAITSELAETALGFERARRSPTQNHRAILPASDAASDLAHPAEQIFDQVGGASAVLFALQREVALEKAPRRGLARRRK